MLRILADDIENTRHSKEAGIHMTAEDDDMRSMKEFLRLFPFEVPDILVEASEKSYDSLEDDEHHAVTALMKSMLPIIKFTFKRRNIELKPSNFGIGFGDIEVSYEPADDEPVFVRESFDLNEEETVFDIVVNFYNMIRTGALQASIEKGYRKHHGY